ncbi:MAG: hypothetical protein JXA07_04170 [Spirochaetes bacterium]|nr:hypothetical protein [Spirochaetota bacterium]
MKKHGIVTLCLFMSLLLTGASPLPDTAGGERTLSVTGLVEKPLFLSARDLGQFNAASVTLTEVLSDKTYTGTFRYRGVPLRTILELAVIKKREQEYSKKIDLIIAVKNTRGEKAYLSWCEVFYRAPSDAVIAFSAEPVRALKSCQSCHAKGHYEKWEAPVNRSVGLPRLVLANDFYSDRCIENITGIEVVDFLPGKAPATDRCRRSETITIAGESRHTLTIDSLKPYRHISTNVKHAGEGRGYHGILEYDGVPLLDLLAENNIRPAPDSIMVFSAPDGYRSVISYGELSLTRAGRDIIIADKKDGRSIEEEGKFNLIVPHDLSSDRWVKTLNKIEIIPVRTTPKLYIIGVGCGDTNLITQQALSAMAKADVFVCTDDIRSRYGSYMGGKQVLFDPLMSRPYYYRKINSKLTEDEIQKTTVALGKEHIRLLKEALRQGRNVGFLDYGDPTIYGSWTYWLLDNFGEEEYSVIPGISAFNAANAMIGKNVAINGSVIITVPDGIRRNEGMVKGAAKNGDTLAIFVGLIELKSLMPVFNKYYPGKTPVIVVYKAGYEKSGRLVRTDLSSVVGVIESEKEKHLGMIYIGRAL